MKSAMFTLIAAAGLAAALMGATPAISFAQGSTPTPAPVPADESKAAVPDQLALDIREAVVRVPVSVKDALGSTISGDLIVTTFRPPGPGPFPLAVINHGRNAKTRAEYKRQRFESAARYFVRKGFAVAVPLRLGYGELARLGDPETNVRCDSPRYAVAAAAAATEIEAVVRFMASTADIDARQVVLVGQSVGGFATIAATAARIDGQVAAINFAGGHGGSPDARPGEPCRPDELERLYREFGTRASATGRPVPTLWVFAANDRYFSPRHQQEWADAYRAGGGRAELRPMPPFSDDGHQLFIQGNDVWQPMVDAFLKPLGFDVPGALPYPGGGEVAVDDLDALPGARIADGYRKFLASKEPRAFATNGRSWGWATGDDAQSRALAFCDRHTGRQERCHLYAVNQTVVWSKP
ncbi:hypothetical protein [Roseateles sp.]|uniref:alpha/beta hydrolase family protein n=1 Tax=Roseateles sp. TaxID=1971397 RepID=UPI0031D2C8A7